MLAVHEHEEMLAPRDEPSLGGPMPPKRKKVDKACAGCRRSHMTCAEERPCPRCVRRGMAHLCMDVPKQPRKKRCDAPVEMPDLGGAFLAGEGTPGGPAAPLVGGDVLFTPAMSNLMLTVNGLQEISAADPSVPSSLFAGVGPSPAVSVGPSAGEKLPSAADGGQVWLTPPLGANAELDAVLCKMYAPPHTLPTPPLSLMDLTFANSTAPESLSALLGPPTTASPSQRSSSVSPLAAATLQTDQLSATDGSDASTVVGDLFANFCKSYERPDSVSLPAPTCSFAAGDEDQPAMIESPFATPLLTADAPLSSHLLETPTPDAALPASLFSLHDAMQRLHMRIVGSASLQPAHKQQVLSSVQLLLSAIPVSLHLLTPRDSLAMERKVVRLLRDYQQLFEPSPSAAPDDGTAEMLPTCLWRTTGELLLFNNAFVDLLGNPSDQAVRALGVDSLADASLVDLVDAGSFAELWAALARLVASRKPRAQVDNCRLRNLRFSDAPEASLAFSSVTVSFMVWQTKDGVPLVIVGSFVPLAICGAS